MQKIKNKNPIGHACADPDNSNGGGGGGGRIASRGRFVPVFLFKQFGFTFYFLIFCWAWSIHMGAQWLSGRVLDSRLKGCGFEPHRRHCVVVLEQDTFILAYYWFNPGRPVPV